MKGSVVTVSCEWTPNGGYSIYNSNTGKYIGEGAAKRNKERAERDLNTAREKQEELKRKLANACPETACATWSPSAAISRARRRRPCSTAARHPRRNRARSDTAQPAPATTSPAATSAPASHVPHRTTPQASSGDQAQPPKHPTLINELQAQDARLPMNMGTVRSVASKYGIPIKDLSIKINKSTASGAPRRQMDV